MNISGKQASRPKNQTLWIFNHYAATPDLPGMTRHHELATLLRSDGWTTKIFSTPFNHKTSKFDRPVTPKYPVLEQDEEGISFVWIYTFPYRSNGLSRYVNMLSFSLLAVFAGVTRQRPSIVIGSSAHLLAALAAWVVSVRHRVPFVLEVRDLWPESLVQLGLTNPVIIKPLELLEAFLYQRARCIISLTDGITNGIIGRGVSSEKVLLVPNAASHGDDLGMQTRSERRSRLGWEDKVVFIYAGAHGDANGLEHLVSAAGLLTHRPEIKIVCLGDGPEKSALIEQATGLSNVVFMEPVAKNQASAIVSAADVGILSLRGRDIFRGARPNKLFDYLACNLPVITTIDGEAWKIIDEAGVGVLAESDNPVAIAEAIERLTDDPADRKSMSANAIRYNASALSRKDTAVLLSKRLNQTLEQFIPRDDRL